MQWGLSVGGILGGDRETPPRSDRVQGEGRNEAELDLSTPESGFQQSWEFPKRKLTVNWGVGELTREASAEESPQVCASSVSVSLKGC